jgi:hypothetical protein
LGKKGNGEHEPTEFLRERSNQAIRDANTVRSQMDSLANHTRDIKRDRDKNPELADFALGLIETETIRACEQATDRKPEFNSDDILQGAIAVSNDNSFSDNGIVLEAENLTNSEFAQFKHGMQSSNLGDFVKHTTKRMFMSRDERRHLKQVHMQITKDLGNRYRLAINMMVDGRLQKMKNQLILEVEGDIKRLFRLVSRVGEFRDSIAEQTLSNMTKTATNSIKELEALDDVGLGVADIAKRFYKKGIQNYVDDVDEIAEMYTQKVKKVINENFVDRSDSHHKIQGMFTDFRDEFCGY